MKVIKSPLNTCFENRSSANRASDSQWLSDLRRDNWRNFRDEMFVTS